MVEKRRYKDLKKPDQFISTINKIISWLNLYQRPIIIIGGGVIVLILISGIIYHLSLYAAIRSTKLLIHVIKYDTAEVKEKEDKKNKKEEEILNKFIVRSIKFSSKEEKAQKTIEEYKKILKEYGDKSELGIIALIGIANNYYMLKNYSEALNYYKRAFSNVEKVPYLKFLVIESMGLCYEALNKLKEAKEQYLTLEKLEEKNNKLVAKYHLARIEYKLGNKDSSIDYLKQIMEDENVETNFYIYSQAREMLAFIAPQELKTKKEKVTEQLLKNLSLDIKKGKNR